MPAVSNRHRVWATENQSKKIIGDRNMLDALYTIAEVTGSVQGALGCLAAALGVGWVGQKAVEAVGRNPGASGKILVQSIIGMALAEAVAFYALFLGK